MINTDAFLVRSVGEKLNVFCYLHIHPNVITFIALAMSIALPFLHIYKFHWLVFSFIIIRQLCDCFDGAVARKCEKTSKLGGFLDTLADFICLFSVFFIILTMFYKDRQVNVVRTFLFSSIFIISFILINLLIYKSFDFLYDHSRFKEASNSIYKKSIAAFVDNSVVIMTIIAVAYIITVKILYKEQ